MVVLRQAVDPTDVLLVHAPYPGRLKFQGTPSSLFAAVGPFVLANPDLEGGTYTFTDTAYWREGGSLQSSGTSFTDIKFPIFPWPMFLPAIFGEQ